METITGIFSINAGEISNKTPYTANFVLNNNSKENVYIISHTVSCGCTALLPGQTVLKPGPNPITITLNKVGQTGFFSQVVNLELSNQQKLTLSLSGNLVNK